MSVPNARQAEAPEGVKASGRGYWFTPVPVYLLDAVYDPDSPVNAPAAMLWAHVHRHYAWRERVFPSYARLAEETRQSESAVKRQLNALKAAGAITWGATYRARGRSSNEYALAVLEPFRFDRETPRPVQVKNDPHPKVQVKNDPSVEAENDLHPQVKNDPGVESSSYLESTEELLSLPAPLQDAEPERATSEREILSPFEDPDPQQPDPLPGVDVYTDQLTDTAEATARVAASWAEAYKRISNGSTPSPKAVSKVRASAASRIRAGKTVDDLMSIAVDMAETNLTWTDLAEHEAHWLNKQHGLTGTGNGTDDRVKGWLALASDLRDDKRNQPYTDNVWDQMRHQLESGARPDGWERVPHCGHVDCDPITRGRESDDGSGTRTVTWCSACHPNLQF